MEIIKIEDDSPITPVIAKRHYNLRSSGSKSTPSPKEPQEKTEKRSSNKKKPRRDPGAEDQNE
jgi:hypothetical protein